MRVALICIDKPGHLEVRKANREAHLAHIAASGVVEMAGPFLDAEGGMCGSLVVLASAFPAMVVYGQDLLPHSTGMVAGLLFGLAFGIAAFGAAGLGVLADMWGIVAVYKLCAVLPALGLAAFFLPDARH